MFVSFTGGLNLYFLFEKIEDLSQLTILNWWVTVIFYFLIFVFNLPEDILLMIYISVISEILISGHNDAKDKSHGNQVVITYE